MNNSNQNEKIYPSSYYPEDMNFDVKTASFTPASNNNSPPANQQNSFNPLSALFGQQSSANPLSSLMGNNDMLSTLLASNFMKGGNNNDMLMQTMTNLLNKKNDKNEESVEIVVDNSNAYEEM